ncbi:UNKNOWN [Stylonychia lemnae]|uniref:Transmembrane protein n=1 Tax=Stylonychia lemnae TaxID=5949 RepID=A0A078AVT2_STYLE|nr:UNKNOWN [Stylonychia lemnae]|eukprot:CDW86196.1 UNKNOWN [Stylonychia lemnae]
MDDNSLVMLVSSSDNSLIHRNHDKDTNTSQLSQSHLSQNNLMIEDDFSHRENEPDNESIQISQSSLKSKKQKKSSSNKKEEEKDKKIRRKNSWIVDMEDILDDEIELQSTFKGSKKLIEFVPIEDDEKLQQYQNLVMPVIVNLRQNTSQREQQNKKQRQIDDEEVNHQISQMNAATENYVPERGVFKKSQTKTESCINETLGDLQMQLIMSILQETLDIYRFKRIYNAELIMRLLSQKCLIKYAKLIPQKLITPRENLMQQQPQTRKEDQFLLDPCESLSKLFLDLGSYPIQYFTYTQTRSNTIMYIPPKSNENLIVLGSENQMHEFRFKYDIQLIYPEIINYQLQEDIDKINRYIRPIKQELFRTEKTLMLYIIIGLIVTGFLAILVGLLYSYIISIVFTIIFICGLIYMHL